LNSLTTPTPNRNSTLEKPVFAGEKPRKARVTALWAIALYGLFWLAVLWSAVCLPGLDDPMCFGLLRNKHEILEHTPSPKIIFVGGSNLLFGLNGPKIEQGLHRPVVNMGLCLMFPLSYLLDEIKDNVHSGDLVVLSPEYADFSAEYANNIAVADILDIYPRALYWILRSNCLSESQLQTLFGHVRAIGLDKLDFSIHHLRQIAQGRCRWSHGKYNAGLDVLNKDNIDKCGDLTWHLKQKRDNTPSPVLFVVSSHLGQSESQTLNDFSDFCVARGARFVMIPPSVSTAQYGAQKQKVDTIVSECQQRLKVPFMTPPERYCFPVKMIFNNQYHLNKAGRELRADRIIEDLRPVVDELNKKAQ
jgi:hypothetical protein